MRTSALKRHNDWKKAIRKKNICEQVYGMEYYNNLHQYSKNKIHCSCPLCTGKTNDRRSKGNGPVSPKSLGVHIGMTNKRFGNKNYSISDKKKIEKLNSLLNDYYKGEDELNEVI